MYLVSLLQPRISPLEIFLPSERPIQQLVSWCLSVPGSLGRLVVSRDLLSGCGQESWGQPSLERAACFAAAFLQAAKMSQKLY